MQPYSTWSIKITFQKKKKNPIVPGPEFEYN